MKNEFSIKIYINRIITILIFTLSLSLTAQIDLKDFPYKPKAGDCYIKRPMDAKFLKIDCKLARIKKKKEIEALQYKLKNLGYDIDIHGILDDKTIKGFELEKKAKKLRNRLLKKTQRKKIRNEKKLKKRKIDSIKKLKGIHNKTVI